MPNGFLDAENATDKRYTDHQAGINRGRDNPAIAVGERLPRYGRNVLRDCT